MDSLFCAVQSCGRPWYQLGRTDQMKTFLDGPGPRSSWNENTFLRLNGASAIALVVCTISSTSLSSSWHRRIVHPVDNSNSTRLSSKSDLSTASTFVLCSEPCVNTALLKSLLCLVFWPLHRRCAVEHILLLHSHLVPFISIQAYNSQSHSLTLPFPLNVLHKLFTCWVITGRDHSILLQGITSLKIDIIITKPLPPVLWCLLPAEQVALRP